MPDCSTDVTRVLFWSRPIVLIELGHVKLTTAYSEVTKFIVTKLTKENFITH